MEPSVREKWEELFQNAGPALRVRMMEDFFDRLHGKATQTTALAGDDAGLRIVIQYVHTPPRTDGGSHSEQCHKSSLMPSRQAG